MLRGIRPGAALVAAALAVAALAALPGVSSAKRYKSTYLAAPAYPESTLRLVVKGKPRARGIARVVVSGSNASQIDDNGLAFDYTLNVYVMDRRIYPTCARSHSEVVNRVANLPGKVEWIGLELSEGVSGPFETTIVYRTQSFRKLLFCAYSTYVVDDAAVGSLKHDLLKARKRR